MKNLRPMALLCPLSFMLAATAAEEPPGLNGYSSAAARVEREWETKFRAIPSSERLRESMKLLSARPHHVGSPYDKQNAERPLK